MIQTVFYSLVFDYNIKTMEQSGRHWAATAYKNKDYIFGYSAASIATILDKNPDIDYRILTDDVALLFEKLESYNINLARHSGFRVHEYSQEIEAWKSDEFCFWPLIKSMESTVLGAGVIGGCRVVKLDNDLTALKSLDGKFYDHDGSHVWKFERECSNGRDYWGEKLAARTAFGTDKFRIYNTGVWSIHPRDATRSIEIAQLCSKGANVDISSVSYFPDRPGVKATMYSCIDQTSNNYWLHKHGISVMETHEYFEHHCYVTNKEGVFRGAEYLKK